MMISPFIMWCKATLPTAFGEELSYYETLTALTNYLDQVVIPAVNNNDVLVQQLKTQVEAMQTYIDNYFDNLDVQEEINTKLDAMVMDGTLSELIKPFINTSNVIFVNELSDMTNHEQLYVLTTDGFVYQWNNNTQAFENTGLLYGEPSNVFHSQIVPTGTTLLSSLLNIGVYPIRTAEFANITDKPVGIIDGAKTLINYTPAFSSTFVIQRLIDIRLNEWERIVETNGNIYKDWLPIVDDSKIIFEGYSTLPDNTTMFSELRNLGTYAIRTNVLADMTDKPDNIIAGPATLINYTPAYSSTFIIQKLIDLRLNEYTRIIENNGNVYKNWIKTIDAEHIHFIGYSIIPTGTTLLSELRDLAVYPIRTAEFANITDAPTEIMTGTKTLINYTPAFSSTFIIQKLIDVRLNEYTRIIQTNGNVYKDWIQTSILGNPNISIPNNINYAALGDSRTYSSSTNVFYPDVVKKVKSYQNVFNWGVSGSTFVSVPDRQDAYSIVQSHDFSTINIVTINWGYNDFARENPIGTENDTGLDTVCGVLYNVLNYIFTQNPKIYIAVFTPLPRKSGVDTRFNYYVDAIINTCKKYNVPVYNTTADGGLSTLVYEQFFDYDTVHSTDYTYFGEWIASKLP